MGSDNPSGADNQQERLGSTSWLERIPTDLGHYIAGFVDGEGSFNAPIRRARDGRFQWRAGVSFNVSQVGAELPELLRQAFEVGTVRGRQDGVYYYEVTRPRDLQRRVFPFFERFPLRLKLRDIAVLREITAVIQSGLHHSTRHRQDPHTEGPDEPWKKAASHGRRDPWGVVELRILRGHTQGSLREAAGMKIWSTPHGDMGNHVNYNGWYYQLAVGKLGCMLEHPAHPAVLVHAQ